MAHHRYTNITGAANYGELGSGGSYKSQLERDEVMYWLMEPDVAKVIIEPTPKKQYILKGKKHDYTPDLLVSFSPASGRKSFYVECKYADMLDDELKEKHECIRLALASGGEIFIVRTEKDTYDESFPARRFLLFSRDEPCDTGIEKEILTVLAEAGELEVGCLLKRLGGNKRRQMEIVPQVWRLAGLHQIKITLTPLLGEQTLVGPLA